MNYLAQARELTALRAEFDWIAAVSQTCQQQVLRDLDTAFGNFFAGRAGYPKPRKKGERDSFRFQGRECGVRRIKAKWSYVRLPKIGLVKFRDTRAIKGKVQNVTVMREANGWHVCFCCEIEHVIPANTLPSVSIDRGVANTLVLSTPLPIGDMLTLPDSLKNIDRRKRKAQRVLSRRKRGSKRYAKQRRRVAALQAKRARIRRDWQHRKALDIAQHFGAVGLEDLKIKNMTASAKGTVEKPGRNVKAKAGLNRLILDQGWGGFEIVLGYKLEERGGTLTLVPAPYRSQECFPCGHINANNRKSQAVFECVACGHKDHADRNSAKVLERRRNTALLDVEGRQPMSPDEASTRRVAA